MPSRTDSPAASPGQTKRTGQAKRAEAAGRASDTITASAVDAYWLQARWTLSEATARRAAKSLGAAFHAARLVMRVQQLSGRATSPVVELLSEAPLPDDCSQWFADVPVPGGRYRVLVGFAAGAEFYAALTSETITTPTLTASGDAAGVAPLSADVLAELREQQSDAGPPLEVHADLMLHGRTRPGSKVLVEEQPIAVDATGHFEIRQRLESGRQIVPVEVAATSSRPGEMVVAAVELSLRTLSTEE